MKALRASRLGAFFSIVAAVVARPYVAAAQATPGSPPAPSVPSVVEPPAPAASGAPTAPPANPPAGPGSPPPAAAASAAAPPALAPADPASSPGAGPPSPAVRPSTPASGAESSAPPPSPPAELDVSTAGADEIPAASIRYVLERIDVRGNRTSADAIRGFVPIAAGEPFEVDDPSIERIRWRLMGTGWFEDVKLRLERGSKRGWVVLVIEVEERNTLRLSYVVAGLSRVVTRSRDRDDAVRPYGGLGVTETNLFGQGIGLGASIAGSEDQLGLDLRYQDPMLLDSGFALTSRLFYADAREFFGRDPRVFIECPVPDPDATEPPDPCDPDVLARRAVVIYDRYGFGLGTGHDISSNFRYEFDWLGEIVAVDAKPSAASTHRGDEIVPLDFHLDDGTSYVSSLRLAVILDRRDDPALPSRGQLGVVEARFASPILGSTYDFARFDFNLRHWSPLPWGHVISLGIFAGTTVGRAPFFYRYYAADLSDLLPSRVLELNLDHRPTHNLLGTSIIEFDKAEIASRVDFEYQLPLHRGGGAIRGVDAYAGAGLFLLAEHAALRTGVQGYDGFARIPVDLTFDLGLQADTMIGLFRLGFSSLIGFLPDLGQDAP